MYDPRLSFTNLLSPLDPIEFLEQHYRNRAVHIQGPPDKFGGLFDWDDFNRIINMSHVWHDGNVKMVLDGEPVPSKKYCTQDGLDRAKMMGFIEKGATLLLQSMESYVPAAKAVMQNLRSVTGAMVQCNLFCSWKDHPGFLPHFDFMDVFIIHVIGEKTWNIYESHFENPILKPGYNHQSFSREFHAKNKGPVESRLPMTPGDMLYIPRGKYHAAEAASDASIHLTFGVYGACGTHYVDSISELLPDDPLLRADIPPYDGDAFDDYIDRVAERVRDILRDPKSKERMRRELRQGAFGDLTAINLPREGQRVCFLVHAVGSRLTQPGGGWRLQTPSGESVLNDDEAAIADWLLKVDFAEFSDLESAFPDKDATDLAATLARLAETGLFDPL